MPYLKAKNPYNPGYALPKNVLAEPEIRGTLTTRKAPAGTIDSYRAAKKGSFWASGYALPANVKGEIPGQGVNVTSYAPRGTIDAYVKPTYRTPEPVNSPKNTGLGNYDDTTFRSRSKMGLEGVDGVGKDALTVEAEALASQFVAIAKKLPADQRAGALRTMLNNVGPMIATDVDAKVARLRAREPGIDAFSALRRAMSATFANHLLDVFQKAGTAGTSALGCMDCENCQPSLDGFWSTISDFASDAKNAVKNTICRAANSRAVGIAAVGAASIAGSPAAGAATAAGIKGTAAVCGGGGSSSGPAPAAPQAYVAPKFAMARSLPGGVQATAVTYGAPAGGTIMGIKTPYLIGGVAAAGLVAYLAMRKK